MAQGGGLAGPGGGLAGLSGTRRRGGSGGWRCPVGLLWRLAASVGLMIRRSGLLAQGVSGRVCRW